MNFLCRGIETEGSNGKSTAPVDELVGTCVTGVAAPVSMAATDSAAEIGASQTSLPKLQLPLGSQQQVCVPPIGSSSSSEDSVCSLSSSLKKAGPQGLGVKLPLTGMGEQQQDSARSSCATASDSPALTPSQGELASDRHLPEGASLRFPSSTSLTTAASAGPHSAKEEEVVTAATTHSLKGVCCSSFAAKAVSAFSASDEDGKEEGREGQRGEAEDWERLLKGGGALCVGSAASCPEESASAAAPKESPLCFAKTEVRNARPGAITARHLCDACVGKTMQGV